MEHIERHNELRKNVPPVRLRLALGFAQMAGAVFSSTLLIALGVNFWSLAAALSTTLVICFEPLPLSSDLAVTLHRDAE